MAKVLQIPAWLEHDYPMRPLSLLKGLEECFNINRLDVPRSLHRCLTTYNVVDNPPGGP
jgi:putative transposase